MSQDIQPDEVVIPRAKVTSNPNSVEAGSMNSMEQYIKSCPYCGGSVSLVSSTIVYHGKDFGLIYLCDNYPGCDAYVGVHKGTNRPLGRLANAELREWKKKAHAAFNPLYKSGRMSRKQAYKLMQSLMNMDDEEAHIGNFDIEQCRTLIEKLAEYHQQYLNQ